METRDMVVEIVYESKNGLYPLQIAQEVSRRYQVSMNTRQVEEIVRKNPKLFVDADGLIKAPEHK